MSPWFESVAVVFLGIVGVFLGRWFSKLPAPYWTFGYFLAAVPLFLLWFGRTYSQWELIAPFSWVCAGRTKFAIVGVISALLLLPPLGHVRSALVHRLVWGFLVVLVCSNSVWPFLSPALNRNHLLSLKNRFDHDGICLQNTDYTCGPAASVTALKRLGLSAEESELAVLAHTSSATGTPPDMLWTALRKRFGDQNLRCEYRHFRHIRELTNGVTIAVIKYGPLVDHYVTVLDVSDGSVTVGDPLKGKVVFTEGEFSKKWRYLGIVLSRAPST